MTDQKLFERLKHGLSKTRGILSPDSNHGPYGKLELTADILTDIEDRMLLADVGIDLTQKLIANLKEHVARAIKNGTAQIFYLV